MSKPVYICGYSLRLAGSNSPCELANNLKNKVNMVQSNSKRFSATEFNVPTFATLKQDLNFMDHTFFGINGGQAERLLLETDISKNQAFHHSIRR